MSLQVFIDNVPDGLDMINDVRRKFLKIRIKDTEITRKLLNDIEQGSFLSDTAYKDRYGYKLPIDDMSEGCKAALCVEYCQNSVVDTIECGDNAIDAIIRTLRDGAILLHTPVCLGVDAPIDAVCNGYHFTDGYELCRYLEDDYPYPLGTMDRRVK